MSDKMLSGLSLQTILIIFAVAFVGSTFYDIFVGEVDIPSYIFGFLTLSVASALVNTWTSYRLKKRYKELFEAKKDEMP